MIRQQRDKIYLKINTSHLLDDNDLIKFILISFICISYKRNNILLLIQLKYKFVMEEDKANKIALHYKMKFYEN